MAYTDLNDYKALPAPAKVLVDTAVTAIRAAFAGAAATAQKPNVSNIVKLEHQGQKES